MRFLQLLRLAAVLAGAVPVMFAFWLAAQHQRQGVVPGWLGVLIVAAVFLSAGASLMTGSPS